MLLLNTVRIESIDDERVSLYTGYSEPQLYHINEPGSGIFIAETPMVIERAMNSGAEPISFFAETSALGSEAVRAVLKKAEGVQVYTADLKVINEITGFNLTRGLLAAFTRPVLPDVSDILDSAGCVAVLEDIVNPTNVGAIFRSAAALGADAVLMTRGSTDPYYRRSARVSMGTVFMIPWTYAPKETEITALLHKHGFTVISMALTEDAVPLTDPVLKKNKRKALIFGAEGSGLKKETIAASDHVVMIPMEKGVDSLNVAASSAVAFWELCGR